MSSLRSSRGHASVTLDRLRYGNVSGPGVLAVDVNGVVGPTGTANLQNLNVSGVATIETLIIDDVDFAKVTATDFQTVTLEVSGTGSIEYLQVGGFTGSTGAVNYLTVNQLVGATGSFQNLTVVNGAFQNLTGVRGAIQNLTVGGITGTTGAFQNLAGVNGNIQNLTVGGITGTTGTIRDLTVDNLVVNIQIIDNNQATAYSGNYIAGQKIRAGDENAMNTANQTQALYVLGDAFVSGGITGTSLKVTGPASVGSLTSGGVVNGTSLNITGAASVGSLTSGGVVNGTSLNITGAASVGSLTSTGTLTTTGIVSASALYTDTIYPYPVGTTGGLAITSGVNITNASTADDPTASRLQISHNDGAGNGSIAWYYVGQDSRNFGGDNNNKEQFCMYSYPKPSSAPATKVESTPLKAGTTGPAGVTGAVGDKYFYGSVQVAGGVYGATGSFQNITVQNITINGTMTMNGTSVMGVQIV